MFLAFISLVMLNGLVGVLIWIAWRRISEHLRNNPEAAQLVSKVIAEHVIPPLLIGEPKEAREIEE